MKYWTRRQKTAAVIGIVVLLIAQILPYKAFFAPMVPVDHLECVELSRAPECASEKSVYAYEVVSDGTRLSRIDEYPTCYEYYTHPKLEYDACILTGILALVVGLADIVLVIILLYNIAKRVKDKFMEWWESEGDDEA